MNHPQHHYLLAAAHFIQVKASTDSDFDVIRQLTRKVGVNLDE